MSGRLGVRRTVVAAGVVLVAGLLLAPLLPPLWVIPLSVLWYLALAALLWAALSILPSWVGRRGAVLLLALAAAPILLTAVPTPPSLALWLPCHRNWGWLPTWLLRSSPMGSLRFEVGGVQVKLCYGRPALRGRRMLGGSRVPFGRLWRTGANEPTTLITTAPLDVAGVPVPTGRVALYTIPGPESWELIVNAATGQWGLESEYTAAVRARELGHAILPSEPGDPVERLTFRVEPAPLGDTGTVELLLAWDTTRLRIPIRPLSR